MLLNPYLVAVLILCGNVPLGLGYSLQNGLEPCNFGAQNRGLPITVDMQHILHSTMAYTFIYLFYIYLSVCISESADHDKPS